MPADDQLPYVGLSEEYPDEIDNYSGLESDKEIAHHMKASMLGQQPFSVKIGNLGMIELNQNRDPEEFAIEGKNGFFKFTVEPYVRGKKLLMYGYDLYDGMQFGESGLLCMCMIMRLDGMPSGYILFKLGKTRCSRPRVDGFLYHISEDQ